jgi:rRNA maturation protein Nop10
VETEPDLVLTAEGPKLGKNTRQCKSCGRVYVLREYVNPCPICGEELPVESPAG